MTILILLSLPAMAITSCYDFSNKVIHDYSFEYGTYEGGGEWYKIKDSPSKLENPYGYSEAKDNRMDSYWEYYNQFKTSFTPKEGAVKYTKFMGSGEMSINDAAANMANQRLFLEEFTPTEVCHPDFKIEVEEPVFDEEEEIDMEPDEYVEIEPIKEIIPEEKTCLDWQELKDNHCVDRCPGEDQSWEEKIKKCVDLAYDPCTDFISKYSTPGLKYDLKYNEEDIKAMMSDALKSYTLSNDLYDEDTIANPYRFLKNWASAEPENKVDAPKEDDVLMAIKKRFEDTQKLLTPGDVFKVCLEETGGKVDTALYTCHNVLKWRGYKKRFDEEIVVMNKDKIKDNEDIMAGLDQVNDAKKIDNYKVINEKLREENIARSTAINLYSTYLENIRPHDNVGAWYHLFGTTSASYRMGDMVSSVCVWGEHKIFKGVFGTGTQHDYVEHCWDSWATEIGRELNKDAKEAGIVVQA